MSTSHNGFTTCFGPTSCGCTVIFSFKLVLLFFSATAVSHSGAPLLYTNTTISEGTFGVHFGVVRETPRFTDAWYVDLLIDGQLAARHTDRSGLEPRTNIAKSTNMWPSCSLVTRTSGDFDSIRTFTGPTNVEGVMVNMCDYVAMEIRFPCSIEYFNDDERATEDDPPLIRKDVHRVPADVGKRTVVELQMHYLDAHPTLKYSLKREMLLNNLPCTVYPRVHPLSIIAGGTVPMKATQHLVAVPRGRPLLQGIATCANDPNDAEGDCMFSFPTSSSDSDDEAHAVTRLPGGSVMVPVMHREVGVRVDVDSGEAQGDEKGQLQSDAGTATMNSISTPSMHILKTLENKRHQTEDLVDGSLTVIPSDQLWIIIDSKRATVLSATHAALSGVVPLPHMSSGKHSVVVSIVDVMGNVLATTHYQFVQVIQRTCSRNCADADKTRSSSARDTSSESTASDGGNRSPLPLPVTALPRVLQQRRASTDSETAPTPARILLDIGGNHGQSVRAFMSEFGFVGDTHEDGVDGSMREQGTNESPSFAAVSFEPDTEWAQFFVPEQHRDGSDAYQWALISAAAWVHNDGVELYVDTNKGGAPLQGQRLGTSPSIEKWNTFATEATKFPSVDLSEWCLTHLHPTDVVVLKLNVEGGEFDIVPHLLETGAAALFDVAIIDWHGHKMHRPHSEAQRLLLAKEAELKHRWQQETGIAPEIWVDWTTLSNPSVEIIKGH